MPLRRTRPRGRHTDPARRAVRQVRFEPLESRRLLTGLPYGAVGQDTAEYMLGNVVATVVFFESNGTIDANTENWNPLVRDQLGNVVFDDQGRTISASGDNLIEATKGRVIEGMQWWEDALVEFYDANYIDVAPIHSLNFTLDFQYAHNPVPTGYEPISRKSQDYPRWVSDFLRHAGYLATGAVDTDIRTFNNAQRLAYEADWAFTIFVVNDYNDSDHLFATGSTFSQAFSFAGGRFLISPATRPASTFAHETGHIFYARDEYPSSGASYTDRRGYYNSQNWNAWNNPTPGFVQQPSLMNAGLGLQTAYANHTSSDSSLAMIGWQDTDGDGVFDALDVPLTLIGSGYYDPLRKVYRFVGSSAVQTLPNMNSSGRGNDITLNEVSQLVYSLDGGTTWTVFRNYNSYEVAMDVSIPVEPGDEILIRTQAVDPLTHQIVVTSEGVFAGSTSLPSSVIEAGITGFVWYDKDLNGQWDLFERGVPGWTMQLVDAAGVPVQTAGYLEPDAYQHQEVLNSALDGVTLTAVGYDVKDGRVGALDSNVTSTGSRVFGLVKYGIGDSWVTEWTSLSRTLRIDFDSPVTYLSLDAMAAGTEGFGRLEIYDAAGRMLQRYSTQSLQGGDVETMWLGTPTAQISYAMAYGGDNTSILLDNLQVGPSSSVVSDPFGAYAFSYLPAGQYYVQGLPTANWEPSDPASGVVAVTVAANGDMQWSPGADRPSDVAAKPSAIASPWQNLIQFVDVNDDWRVSPIDALLLINELNLQGSRVLSPPDGDQLPPPYLDVSGDNRLSPIDVLLVIDYLNGGSGGATPTGSGSGGGSGESGTGEGELVAWVDIVAPRESLLPRRTAVGDEGAFSAARLAFPEHVMADAGRVERLRAAGPRTGLWGHKSAAESPVTGLLETPGLTDNGWDWSAWVPGALIGEVGRSMSRLRNATANEPAWQASQVAWEGSDRGDWAAGTAWHEGRADAASDEETVTLLAMEFAHRRLGDIHLEDGSGVDAITAPFFPDAI